MRKLLVLLLPVLLIALLAGCGKKPDMEPETRPADTTVEETDIPTEQEPPPTTAVEEAVVPDFVTIYFDFDKYNLKPDAQMILKRKADFLRKNANAKVIIEGHCDERGSTEYNLALGDRRANSAKTFLVNLGIAESRLTTISYGEERPLDPAHNNAAWAKNRRAQFVIE